MKLQEIVMALIAGTICLSLAAVVLLSAFGRPVEPGLAGTIVTAFLGMAGTAGGWLARGKEQSAQTNAVFQTQRAQIAEMRLQGLRNNQ